MAINAALSEHNHTPLLTHCLWLLNKYLLNERMNGNWSYGHER